MKQKAYTPQVLRNAFFQIISTVIAKLGGFIFTIIIARMLFPELFGLYSLALAVILILMTFADLGLNQTLIRYTSEALGKKQKTKARSYTKFLLNFKILIAGIFALALFLAAKPLSLYIFHKEALILPLQIGAIYLFVTALLGFFFSLFYALQKVKFIVAKEGIFQVARIALVIAFLVAIKSVPYVFIALSIAAFLAFLFCFFIVSKNYTFLLKGPLIKIDKKRLLKFFGYLSIGSITGAFFIYIDRLMLGAFLPSEFIGFYTAIFAIVGAIAGIIAMTNVLLPVFTQIKGQRLERAFNKVFHYSAIFSFPCAFGFAALAPWILKVIYGVSYVPFEYIMPISIASALLAFLIIEMATGRFFATLFYSKEKPQFPVRIIVMATVINIILNYFFIRYFITIGPAYGLVGAALATFISRYFYFGALAVSSKRRLKIMPQAVSVWKPLVASLVMLAFLLGYNYFVDLTLLLGIIEIIIAIAIYFVVMLLIKGIKKEDFKLMRLLKTK